jgi:hypothetical protein
VDRRREKGSGGIVELAHQVWRVDVEFPRGSVTGRRRGVSQRVMGTGKEAELMLAPLKMADHHKRLPSGGTIARSVAEAMACHQEAAEGGSLELAPKMVTTSRSVLKVMKSMELRNGRTFGSIPLS